LLIGLFWCRNCGRGLVFYRASNEVKIDNSSIVASSIDLAPSVAEAYGCLCDEGDTILQYGRGARGNELVKSKINGLVIMAREDIGKIDRSR